MAATVAAHKTIVQDISLASPFRISAPLYWHARFSFLSFLLFRFLFRLHGVLRAARTRETERERERFGTMIMRLDAPPMHFDYILAGRNVYPATFRSYSYPFLLIAFLFFQPPLWSTVMEIRCTLVDRRCMHTRFRSGESEFRFELYTLTFSTMRNFLCFFRCRKYLIVACLDWWMVVRFWFIPLTLSGGKNDGNRRCFEHSLPCLC